MTTTVELPHDDQMEQAVLGSLLIDPIATVTIADILKPEDFYTVRHQWVYEALLDLGDRADLITVAQHLATSGRLVEAGGESYLAQLTVNVATALNVEEYAANVAEDGTRRRLIQACSEVAKLAFDQRTDATYTAERAVTIMERAATSRAPGDIIPASAAAEAFARRMEAALEAGNVLPGIPTGLQALDAVTNGWQPGDFDIISGAPGGGKTSLATQALYYAAAQFGKRGMLFTLEMPEPQMTTRFISHISGVPYQLIDRPWAMTTDQLTAVTNATAKFHDLPIWIVDVSYLTPAGALARIAQHQRRHGLDLAVIDQLQLMSASTRGERRLEIVEITRALKLMPKKVGNIPLIVLSQLSRNGYGEPQLSDLKESGSIESDADKVIFVYAPNEDARQDVTLKVAKNRKGATMKVRAKFERAVSRFTSAEDVKLS